MSSLHESVSRRRAAESAPSVCVTIESGTPTLLVVPWEGPSWLFPWAHFGGARLERADTLEISFPNHRITVTGENLAALWGDLAALRVAALRSLPGGYRAAAEPYIAALTVETVRESP